MRMLRLVIAGLIILGALETHAFPGPGQQYIVKEDLGVLPGHSDSSAADINSTRQVTGYSGAPGNKNAFLWAPPGPMVALEPADKVSDGEAINDTGQIAGDADFLIFAQDAFLWTPPGPAVGLVQPPGGVVDEGAADINNLGEVVGQWEAPPFKPYLWRPPGPMMDIGTLGGNTGFASGINDSTEVVGVSDLGDGTAHGFYWTEEGGMLDLGALGTGTESAARAINTQGEIVGTVSISPFIHAAYWPAPGAVLVDLGTLGGPLSKGNDINDNGVIVGESAIDFFGTTHAFRLKPGGLMSDLGTLGGTNSRARGLNNSGHIVGEAQLPNGDTHAVAWWVYTVTPETACQCYIDYPANNTNYDSGNFLRVVIPGTRELDVREVDPRTLTLGDSVGDEAPVAQRGRSGRLHANWRDVDNDGNIDLIVRFRRFALIRNGDLTPRTEELWVQGTVRDRRTGFYGVVTLPRPGR